MLFAMQRQMHKNQKVQRTVEITQARFADSVADVPVDMMASFHKVQKTAVASREENRCRSEDSRGPTVSDREELGESVDVAKTAQNPQLLTVKKIVGTPDIHTVHDEPDTRSPDAEAENTSERDIAAQSGEGWVEVTRKRTRVRKNNQSKDNKQSTSEDEGSQGKDNKTGRKSEASNAECDG